MFLSRMRPRGFTYQPRFYKEEPGDDKRIRIERKTIYDRHQGGMRFFTLLIMVFAISALIWYIVPRLSTVKPEKTVIRVEDVVEFEKNNQK